MKNPAVAVFSHSHPDFTRGGAEIVAYNSFLDFRSKNKKCVFISSVLSKNTQDEIFKNGEYIKEIKENEFIINCVDFDSFFMIQSDVSNFKNIKDIIENNDIEILHFHHFWLIGFNMISYLIKNLKNQIFSLTLHEFLAICQRDGQMVKNNTNELCYEGNAKNCKKCFPTFAEYMFEGKFEVAKSSLSEFDILTSPSNFLAKRFINTKFSDKIEVISNGLKYKDEIFACDENFIERKFAYFGQLTPYKGIALFIDAILIFEEKFNNFAQFSIYGMREEQFYNSDIGKKYKERIKNSNPSLNFFGSYEPENVISLMREHGTVVVPSIWWENSPLVIQEAFQASRPVITANIGGMLESVRDRIDGLHFEHGNSFSLFEKMLNIAFDREMWKHLRENIRKPNSIQEMNKNFINQYRIAQKRKYMFSSGSIPKS